MDDPSIGVKCTIIDLGLARIDHGCGDAYWTPFEEEIFDGEGDYQYDVYRMMRKSKKDNWEAFQPLTNVMVGSLCYRLKLQLKLKGISVASLPC